MDRPSNGPPRTHYTRRATKPQRPEHSTPHRRLSAAGSHAEAQFRHTWTCRSSSSADDAFEESLSQGQSRCTCNEMPFWVGRAGRVGVVRCEHSGVQFGAVATLGREWLAPGERQPEGSGRAHLPPNQGGAVTACALRRSPVQLAVRRPIGRLLGVILGCRRCSAPSSTRRPRNAASVQLAGIRRGRPVQPQFCAPHRSATRLESAARGTPDRLFRRRRRGPNMRPRVPQPSGATKAPRWCCGGGVTRATTSAPSIVATGSWARETAVACERIHRLVLIVVRRGIALVRADGRPRRAGFRAVGWLCLGFELQEGTSGPWPADP
jgi:hypothetical protein